MLVITLGDPFSVSLECLFRLEDLWAKSNPGPVVLVGSHAQWLWQERELAFSSPNIQVIKTWDEVSGKGLFFLDIAEGDSVRSPKELSIPERGAISVKALESLRNLKSTAFKKLAVVTAPIDKSVASGRLSFPGSNRIFLRPLAGERHHDSRRDQTSVALATNHVKLSDVTALITEELICQKLEKFHSSLKNVLGISRPRIAVAALNPHAGDQGMFGDEDSRIIAPAVKSMQSRGLDVTGPRPADTIFFQAYNGQFDGVLAMYHDQGLAPLKSLHFYDAVNISGGLPHLRISPDHGPAGDLYGRNLAKEDSFRLSLIHARNYLGW